MSSGQQLREFDDEKLKLQSLIKKAWPYLSAAKAKIKLDEYWTQICFNPKKHSKKLIIVAEYNKIVNDLNSKIIARKARLDSMWGNVPTVPANSVIAPLASSNNNETITICCRRLRSNVHDILPNQYYPAPRYFTHSNGILETGKKYTDPGKSHHYADFTMICALERAYPHGTDGDCHDDYNPDFNNEKLQETRCRVCLKWFPSKKMMLNHRRAIHYRSREDNMNDIDDDDVDYEVLLLDAEQRFYDNIDRICDDRNGQYLAVMNNGSRTWVVLDDENEKVAAYLELKSNLDSAAYDIPNIDDLRVEFMSLGS